MPNGGLDGFSHVSGRGAITIVGFLLLAAELVRFFKPRLRFFLDTGLGLGSGLTAKSLAGSPSSSSSASSPLSDLFEPSLRFFLDTGLGLVFDLTLRPAGCRRGGVGVGLLL